MAEELQQRIFGTMQQCAEQIRASMQTLNINASGRTSQTAVTSAPGIPERRFTA